tara:strand:- start:430 stop:1212 length:783 start_codon:yes stop_codon:yes gene_type:complete
MGSEKLVFENCIGQFEGVKNFQPAKELRKKLQVALKTNGQITISGHIDLWDVGHSYPTVLSGDINSGEISGIWEEGDLIKIKIVSQKEIEEKQIGAASELSIFEFEGETFNLVLDTVDFIETKSFELERNEKYLHPFQLHKGFIHGSLIKKKGKIDFSTLVFKHSDPQEQRLVIHVDDWTVEPFNRHSDSLQKICGSELMNEWGWLSFISETTDKEKASEQQCHYNYFKEADDKEAWELFQTVLSGTNSILEYLETETPQ